MARQEKLEAVTSGNPWIASFFASHTFEVDFVTAGNSYEVIETLPQIYRQQRNIERSKGQLESDDVAIYGKEVLRLAKKQGKGWFALLLAENLISRTYFPEYILRAVAFACHLSVTESKLREVALYRMEKDDELAPALRRTLDDIELNSEEVLQRYCEEEPKDALTLFRNYIFEFRE